MKILVYIHRYKEAYVPYIKELIEVMDMERIELVFHENLRQELENSPINQGDYPMCGGYEDLKSQGLDYVITLGGDGTILAAITVIRDLEIPILGINLGRLGFLASTEKTLIRESIIMLKRGMFSLNYRSLLYLETNLPLFGETRFALNDFTLLKRDTSSMITIHAYVNGDYLNSYWADGIILATPTGSTGYSLSCGGPIIFPNSGNFVITPVAPHNLNVRPIVISDTSVISFEVEGRTDNFLCTLDSRFETITTEHQIAIRKCDFGVKLVQLNNVTFLKTLQDKLTWGKDKRN